MRTTSASAPLHGIGPTVHALGQLEGKAGLTELIDAAGEVAGRGAFHQGGDFRLERFFGFLHFALGPLGGGTGFHRRFQPVLVDGVGLEHLHGPGHGAQLIGAIQTRHDDCYIAPGQPLHRRGHAAQRRCDVAMQRQGLKQDQQQQARRCRGHAAPDGGRHIGIDPVAAPGYGERADPLAALAAMHSDHGQEMRLGADPRQPVLGQSFRIFDGRARQIIGGKTIRLIGHQRLACQIEGHQRRQIVFRIGDDGREGRPDHIGLFPLHGAGDLLRQQGRHGDLAGFLERIGVAHAINGLNGDHRRQRHEGHGDGDDHLLAYQAHAQQLLRHHAKPEHCEHGPR